MISKLLWYMTLICAGIIDLIIISLFLIKELLVKLYKKGSAYSAFSPKKVLLVRTDRLGDAVITTPVISALKDVQPDLKIYVLASTQNEMLLKKNPHIEKVYTIKVDTWLKYRPLRITIGDTLIVLFKEFLGFVKEQLFSRSFWSVLIQLKAERIDLAIDLIGKKRTTLIGKVIARYSITHNLKSFSYLSDYCLEFPFVTPYPRMHIIERYFYLLSKGIKSFRKIDPFDFGLKISGLEKFPVEKRNGILFHVGGTAYRRLDNHKLLNIIKEVSDKLQYNIYVIDEPGNPNLDFFEENLDKHKVDFIKKKEMENLISFVNKNIVLAVVPDSGFAHVCNALTNTFAYYGQTAIWVWYPWDKSKPRQIKTYEGGAQVWETKGTFIHRFIFYPVDCSPCYEIGCEELHCLEPLKESFFTNQIMDLAENKVFAEEKTC